MYVSDRTGSRSPREEGQSDRRGADTDENNFTARLLFLSFGGGKKRELRDSRTAAAFRVRWYFFALGDSVKKKKKIIIN